MVVGSPRWARRARIEAGSAAGTVTGAVAAPGARPSKFGIYLDRFEEALELAARSRIKVTQVRFHFGYGYLTRDLPEYEEALASAACFLDRCPDADTCGIGGGIGAPITAGHTLLDLGRWVALIASATRSRGLKVHLEPGDYLMKDAGALLCEVNTVENKGGVDFVGIDAGLNLQNLWAYYQTPFVVALLNVGSYGSAAASNHCMRGSFRERLLDRARDARPASDRCACFALDDPSTGRETLRRRQSQGLNSQGARWSDPGGCTRRWQDARLPWPRS